LEAQGHAAAQHQGQAGAAVECFGQCVEFVRRRLQQGLGGGVGASVLEHQRCQIGIGALAARRTPGQHGLALAGLAAEGLRARQHRGGQRAAAAAPVERALGVLDGLAAQPGAAALVADLPAPAADAAVAAFAQQGLADRAGAGDQQRAGLSAMRAEQGRHAVGVERQRRAGRCGVQKGLRQHGGAGTRQAQADGAVRPGVGIEGLAQRGAQGRVDGRPGLRRTLTERRGAGLSFAQQGAGGVGAAQPRVGAAAVHPDPPAWGGAGAAEQVSGLNRHEYHSNTKPRFRQLVFDWMPGDGASDQPLPSYGA
jgi:hypothetical protein